MPLFITVASVEAVPKRLPDAGRERERERLVDDDRYRPASPSPAAIPILCARVPLPRSIGRISDTRAPSSGAVVICPALFLARLTERPSRTYERTA